MYKKEYAAHKKALVERAMMLSVEGLQHAIIGELQKTKEDHLPHLRCHDCSA